MRRVIPVLAATAGGIALLARFQSTPERSTPIGGQALTTVPSTAVPSTAAPSAAAPSTGSSTTTRAPASSVASPRPTSPPSTPVATTRTIVGPDVFTRYGDVQVRITVRGRHLEDVQALLLPNDRQRSAEISQFAGPQLRDEALQAQSANIDMVSGASYTSQGYIQSLQGAIDAIG